MNCVTLYFTSAGLWEVRGDKQHFVYSKVMMWVCLDRGVRLAEKYSRSALNKEKWKRSRDMLYEVGGYVCLIHEGTKFAIAGDHGKGLRSENQVIRNALW